MLLITGHIRSGTTLLRNLCNGHPKLNITMEFGNFTGLWQAYPRHSFWLWRRCYRRRKESFLVDVEHDDVSDDLRWRYRFVLRYLTALGPSWRTANVSKIENALKRCMVAYSIQPEATILGDKSAFYIFHLDQLVQRENIQCVVIYRDCRDVVSSTLRRVRTDWRGRSFTTQYDSAEKAARRWVDAIEAMEKHRDRLVCLRYEDLIQNPAQVLEALAERIGISADGFPIGMVQPDRIGKHRLGLTPAELDVVNKIAGATMLRLGYL